MPKYTGLSTDPKPYVGVSIGSYYEETDTGNVYIYTGKYWLFSVVSYIPQTVYGVGVAESDLMKKSVYDVDLDSVVDEAEKIDGGTW